MFSSQDTRKKPIWHDRVPSANRKRDALVVLREAAENCLERDIQTEEVLSALTMLIETSPRAYVFIRFRKALRIPEAGPRQSAVRNAYDGAERYLTGKCSTCWS
jgi:ATP-dependent helicase YprA (DUF1998 family)